MKAGKRARRLAKHAGNAHLPHIEPQAQRMGLVNRFNNTRDVRIFLLSLQGGCFVVVERRDPYATRHPYRCASSCSRSRRATSASTSCRRRASCSSTRRESSLRRFARRVESLGRVAARTTAARAGVRAATGARGRSGGHRVPPLARCDLAALAHADVLYPGGGGHGHDVRDLL